jgi:hypothetical protein
MSMQASTITSAVSTPSGHKSPRAIPPNSPTFRLVKPLAVALAVLVLISVARRPVVERTSTWMGAELQSLCKGAHPVTMDAASLLCRALTRQRGMTRIDAHGR